MKHKNIAAAAISAVLGLMSLALSAKESYIGTDSTIVVRDYIANMEYVNGVLERVNFEGGYIDMTGESPRYMYYVTGHLGNVRAVVDEDNTLFGRFTTLDPMAEKYYSVSPYAYCAGNPVRFVDPSGKDWYRDSEGHIQWTSLTSQDSMEQQNLEGTYLGPIVVCFEGSMDEKLGWDMEKNRIGNIDGEGAVTAKVIVYGQKSEDDIAIYTGFTLTSDYLKFGAIADGGYDVTYRESAGGGAIPKHYMVNNGGPVDCINNINLSPKEYAPYSDTQKDWIFIHRTNYNGWAGDTPSMNKCVSSGCLLIRAGDWDAFTRQVGKNGFRLLLERR
ncbi:MAG: hypothetical protein MJY88_07670 [Bacteroidales bacterium]|nr:hypothetical protein [Bacteroidales bacterium]